MIRAIVFIFSFSLFAADNEVSIDQLGGTLNLDIEQLGSGNLIGGQSATAGSMTPLDLDGNTMTIDINQIGDSNLFKGDITSDTFTGFFEFDGDSNIFDIQVDPTNTYGADSSNLNIDVTGNSNDMSLDQATVAMASEGVANFIPTVSFGFSSVYNLRPLPFGFLPVPTLGSFFFLATTSLFF